MGKLLIETMDMNNCYVPNGRSNLGKLCGNKLIKDFKVTLSAPLHYLILSSQLRNTKQNLTQNTQSKNYRNVIKINNIFRAPKYIVTQTNIL